jgi:hypothetical protein
MTRGCFYPNYYYIALCECFIGIENNAENYKRWQFDYNCTTLQGAR